MFQDEAAFRQDPTLFRTWSRVGKQPEIPTYGQRNTQHVFGAINVPQGHFLYQFSEKCNGETFLYFLERVLKSFYPKKVYVVIDNARYHRSLPVKEWCLANKDRIEYWFLPPYSPDYNAIEPIWGYTRRKGTHNRFFENVAELVQCLNKLFQQIQKDPYPILNYIKSYA